MEQEKNLVHNLDVSAPTHVSMKSGVIIFVILAVLGIGTGYFFAKGSSSSSTVAGTNVGTSSAKKGAVFGTTDEKTFKDKTEGELKEGGIEGEGAFHLERPGGASQNVYLTSSVVDLSQFVGKKVRVWGETNAAKKAGWLMDVGRLQVIE